jgi:hypothetical protein
LLLISLDAMAYLSVTCWFRRRAGLIAITGTCTRRQAAEVR